MRRTLWLATVAACGASPTAAIDGRAIDAVAIDAPPPGEPWFDEGVRRGRIELLELTTGRALAHANFAPQPTRLRFVFYARVAVQHWQQETLRIGACRLLEHRPAFCEACAALCIAPEVCEAFPEYASAGDLTFDGLRTAPLTLQPSPFYASQAELPTDAFADAATITVTASGAAVPAFTVVATAVPPLDPAIAPIANDELGLTTGVDTVLTWTAVDPTLRVRVAINANNRGHGQPYAAVIECDAADVGALTIASALIDRFPPTQPGSGGCIGSDCPQSTITRYRRGSVDVDGAPIDLIVGAQRPFWVDRP